MQASSRGGGGCCVALENDKRAQRWSGFNNRTSSPLGKSYGRH